MLDNLIKDKKFAEVMKKNLQELIIYFFQKEQHFSILCSIKDVTFDPILPEPIQSEFREVTLFFLAGYTFETAHIEGDYLVFEAGFGSDNIGSVVHIPLLAILQVIAEETPVLINLAHYEESNELELDIDLEESVDELGVKNSMASFLSNPENSKFIKK